MDGLKVLVVSVITLGVVGCISRPVIAAFPGGTLRSESKLVRFISKSAIFCLYLFISSLLSVIPFERIVSALGIQVQNTNYMIWIYAAIFLSGAVILYRIDMAIVSYIFRRNSI